MNIKNELQKKKKYSMWWEKNLEKSQTYEKYIGKIINIFLHRNLIFLQNAINSKHLSWLVLGILRPNH